MNSFMTRRTFLGATATAAALAALSACSASSPSAQRILSTDPLVAKYEARRSWNGTTISQQLVAGAVVAEIAGKNISTWGYNAALIAPTIRAKVGDRLDVSIANNLTEPTSIHWHGLALRNAADGVPDLTQQAIAAGGDYRYQFRLNAPGTYWYHSHVEMQRERALYGALIIDDPHEPLAYDQEWLIVLDDWLDGFAGTPDAVLKELSAGMSMSGMDMSGGTSSMLMNSRSAYLGGDAGDVKIPVHLMNGRTSLAPETLVSKAGNRIRLRIINAAGDTAYRIGVPGQQIELTHSDGFAVKSEKVGAVVLGMGERIDALLTVQNGITALLARPEGKDGSAVGIISTGAGTIPSASDLPSTLTGVVTDGGRLKADDSVLLAAKRPDRIHNMRLTGSMEKYSWGINGHAFDMQNPYAGAFEVRANDRVRVNITNETTMWHPMHLHGHTFQLNDGGARKDTVIVRPKERVTFEFDANNPGQWLTHCHNAYHAARGMMSVFSYVS